MLFNKVVLHVSSQRGGLQRGVECWAGLVAHSRWEIPQNPVTGPGVWDLLDRRLSFSGSLKRGRVSWGAELGGKKKLIAGCWKGVSAYCMRQSSWKGAIGRTHFIPLTAFAPEASPWSSVLPGMMSSTSEAHRVNW